MNKNNVVELPVIRIERDVESSGPWSKELVRAIAMDIGKAVVHHIETMYPQAVAACPATFKFSVRNCTHNEIMAAIEVSDEGRIVARLRNRKEHRRKIKAAYKKVRATPDYAR
jgi:hypothetical protein